MSKTSRRPNREGIKSKRKEKKLKKKDYVMSREHRGSIQPPMHLTPIQKVLTIPLKKKVKDD